MFTISLSRIIDSINEAQYSDFNEELNSGQKYLTQNVVKPLEACEDIIISELDFDAFEYDDLSNLTSIYINRAENMRKSFSYADKIINTPPMAKELSFI